jgi:hypothetical protein
MKLVGKYPWAPWMIFIAFGFFLAIILAFVSGVLFATGLQWEYVWAIDLLIGIFIIGGIGLILVEKSRYIGSLIIALYVPALIYFSVYTHRIILNALFLGIAVGIAMTAFFIYKIRFDWLARTLKYLMDVFVIVFIGYLISVIANNYSKISAQGTLVYFIVAILLTIGLYFFLSKNLYAVTSSDVLIIGPSGSGKSYVIAALALHLVRQNRAVANSYIFSQNPDATDRLTIQNIATAYQKGEKLEPTQMNEMAYYQFNGVVWGVIPIRVTCLDYAGGLFGGKRFELINEQNYENKVNLIAQIMGRTPTEVMRNFGDISFFWNDFYEHFRSDFYATFNDIVPAFIYARLLKAGKIVFLIDGEKVLSSGAKDPEWDSYLLNIHRLIESLGDDKDYAFAITKADLIPDIKNIIRGEKTPEGVITIPGISEDSRKAIEIEDAKIKNLFADNFHLNTIYNAIMKDSFIRLQYIEGFLISVDCSPRAADKADNAVTGEHPWRLKEIARYIMKF